MAQTTFLRFFNKKGEDFNFSHIDSDFGNKFEGAIYFPKVSVNLIESENIFLLQEVTIPTAQPNLKRLSGIASTIAGNSLLNVQNGKLTTELNYTGATGDLFQIEGTVYGITGGTGTFGPTSMNIALAPSMTSPPTATVTSEDFYLLDFVGYNRLIASSDVVSESLYAEFPDESGKFFFYEIDYQENLPLISKKRTIEIPILAGPTVQDLNTGRIIVSATAQNVTPSQLNIGFSSTEEGVFEEPLNLYLKKSINFEGSQWQGATSAALPVDNGDGTWTIDIGYVGYSAELDAVQTLYLSRSVPGGGYQYFELKLVSYQEFSLYTSLVVKEVNTSLLSAINSSNVSSFGLYLVWREFLLQSLVYGEAEAEDERFKLTLENFGRKIDEENEYIFRDSAIDEELTDYRLLNKKRKELLLEGDKIYPYMGSYKALINVLNLFGYNDVEIKEYFLNVDATSLDNGKFISVPIAKSAAQNNIVKKAWKVLPSKIYKKTSLFGLYYKLNKVSGDYDEFGVPLVTEDYQFTAEEVLIKLFGLKEVLKKDYLPLNARIYDITGEGIYFERYRLNNWSDSVDIRVLEIGKVPDLVLYPQGETYIRDLRYIDYFYQKKFIEQGLTGFLGPTASNPGLTASSTPLNSIYTNWLGSFELYQQGDWSYRDQFWDSMPPGISNPEFNVYASYKKQLPDDVNVVSGAPVLSEVNFTLTWEESTFSWNQCYFLSSFAGNFTASIGATGGTVSITDLTSTIQDRGFSVGSTVTISNTEFDGNYSILSISGNTFDININVVPVMLAGSVSYSTDINQVSSSINRLSWDTIARGEYIDMRIMMKLVGEKTFFYDSGRQPIENFTVDYTDTAGITYKRILHAVSLPYTGVYDISVYVYDITNNFTMQYVKKEVKTPEVVIAASYQAQEIFDNFDDINVKWKEATFDWYYPSKPFTTWEQANLNWDSVELYAYKNQDLVEDKTLVDILEIDRTASSVLIQGDVTDNPLATAGEYLYFTRLDSALEIENSVIQLGSFVNYSNGTFELPIDPADFAKLQLYSKVIIKNTEAPFNSLSAQDFFYAEVIGLTGTLCNTTFKAYQPSIDIFEASNVMNLLYLDSGFYAGTYAIEIASLKAVSGNTLFFLKDTQKELYKIDGYFQPYLTSYDVDFAETHIGIEAETYENSYDTTWNSLDEKAWWSKERHAVLNSGFLITRVSPGGTIQVSDFDEFTFSGSSTLNQYGYTAMNQGLTEILASTNEGMNHYEYQLMPLEPKILKDLSGSTVSLSSPASGGSLSIVLGSTPFDIKVPAELTIGLSGSSLTFSIASSGSGYILPPNVTLQGGGGTGASISLSINSYGAVDSFTAVGGTGYTSVPTYAIENPLGYEDGLTNYAWTGLEWIKIDSVTYSSPTSSTLSLNSSLSYPVPSGAILYMPYAWHQVQYMASPTIQNSFYVAIHGSAKTPSLKDLHEVVFTNGTEGEWVNVLDTNSYPLGNSLLYEVLGKTYNSAQYDYWEANGKDFPVTGNNEDDSRALYAGAYSEGFSFSDINMTDSSFKITRSTTVIFHDDASRLPTKKDRVWKIIDAETGQEEVVSNSNKLVWKFTRSGEFSVELSITDKYGNVAKNTKKSFVHVV
jgi:hypothetical protein